jgi:hypothetical protein
MNRNLKIYALATFLLNSCVAPEPQLSPQELAARAEAKSLGDQWEAAYYQWLVKREFSDAGPPPAPPPQLTPYSQTNRMEIARLKFSLEYGRNPRPRGDF